MSCVIRVRTALAIIGVLTIVASSILLVAVIFNPKTHLELLVIKTYPNGESEAVIYKPTPFQLENKAVVESGVPINYNETLVLLESWVIQPSDWKPTVHIHLNATVTLIGNEKLVVNHSLITEDDLIVKAENQNKTPLLRLDITPRDLLTCLGKLETPVTDIGKYKLIIDFNVKTRAIDPDGNIHILKQKLTYVKEYQIVEVSKIFKVTGEIKFNQPLEVTRQPTYQFQIDTSKLYPLTLLLMAIGFTTIIMAFASPIPQAICKLKS